MIRIRIMDNIYCILTVNSLLCFCFCYIYIATSLVHAFTATATYISLHGTSKLILLISSPSHCSLQSEVATSRKPSSRFWFWSIISMLIRGYPGTGLSLGLSSTSYIINQTLLHAPYWKRLENEISFSILTTTSTMNVMFVALQFFWDKNDHSIYQKNR